MAALSWTYPADALIAIRKRAAQRRGGRAGRERARGRQLHFNYAISGDKPAWRPLRAFDDGRQTFIEFPATLGAGEAPPLFLVDGKARPSSSIIACAAAITSSTACSTPPNSGSASNMQVVVRITRGVPDTASRSESIMTAADQAPTQAPEAAVEPASVTPKVSPEPLVMRAKLPLVTRFRRELIIAVAAVALLAIGAIVGLALRSHASRPPGDSEDQTVPAKPPGEVVADAPKSYAGVPQLGQPLPGDLGQPILDHQRASVGPINPPAADPELERARQAAKAARDQHAAELEIGARVGTARSNRRA